MSKRARSTYAPQIIPIGYSNKMEVSTEEEDESRSNSEDIFNETEVAEMFKDEAHAWLEQYGLTYFEDICKRLVKEFMERNQM